MRSVLVFGAGGHAKVVIDIIEKSGVYQVAGLIDQSKPKGTIVFGYEVLGDETYLLEQEESISGGIVAIGDNWTRYTMVASILKVAPDFHFIPAVHPSAQIGKGAQIGAGTVVMAGAVVNSDTIIGRHCIVNTRASIDHDCIMGDFSALAPHATTGANVRIGDFSAISLGANVVHSIQIGEHTVIGAGATVLSAIGSNVIAYGLPAKVIRSRQVGERYL
jgi:sugar O-acyltransferase (sialic acid O-acetyltransferase NeuD family)